MDEKEIEAIFLKTKYKALEIRKKAIDEANKIYDETMSQARLIRDKEIVQNWEKKGE